MIKIKTKKGIIEMTCVEFAKWACLVEAFHFIQEKAVELNVNLDNFIKPLAIEKYIEERYPSMLHDVEIECKLGNI